jgi:hypothetical protein
MEVHTPTNPYCTDPGCWCHSDALYHDWILQASVPTDGQLAQAYAFFGLVDEGTNAGDGYERPACIAWSSQGGM